MQSAVCVLLDKCGVRAPVGILDHFPNDSFLEQHLTLSVLHI